jgi:ubiquinone/menaquinone biosynthesis C-methylase UbiE
MGLYEKFVLPAMLDFAMRQKPIEKQREKVVPKAAGKVLEIGIGSGLNLDFYDSSKIEKLWGLDPSTELQVRARDRAAAAGVDVEFLLLSAEEIPLQDQACDTVLVTYTLCTIPEPDRALAEMRRVLKPDGKLIFCEHGHAPDANVARWQDRLNPMWKKIAGGCNMNRKIPGLLEDAGFEIDELETMYIPGVRALSFNYWGQATPAS